MFTVLECVTVQHDRLTVVLAASIALAGMLAFFLLLVRADECNEERRRSWIAIAAFAGGLSVWATHFVAMLAYRGGMPIEFQLWWTSLSAVAVVLGFWAALRGLHLSGRAVTVPIALIITLSVAAMHFIGMAGLNVAATIRYDWTPILIGSLVAWLLFIGAFWSFRHMRTSLRVILSAVFAILAICALHFTAVSATTLIPDPNLAEPMGHGLGRLWLIGVVSVVTFSVAVVTVVAVFIDRYLTDLKGFADSTLDGLAIVRDGRVVEVNSRLVALLGKTEEEILGHSPDAFLTAVDGLSVGMARPAAVEATPLSGASGRIFELAVHTIEYRGRPCEVIAARDLTEKKAVQSKIEYMARHDALTDLPNRTLFRERLEHAITRAGQMGETVAVLALDLDRFKAVNDLFGHAEGDRVLKDVAGILKRCVRASDTVARLGGDEFIILQAGVAQPDGARLTAERILETFRVEMDSSVDPTAVGVSIGVAVFPKDGANAEYLQHAADIALYRAKTSGRGMAAFYDLGMDEEIRARRSMENDLRQAVSRGEMRLVYQPLMVAERGEPAGYEALLRWTHPERGEIPPDIFIPIAEETGSIISLGEWVLREACRAAARWPSGLFVAVNVSPVQFRLANLASVVREVLGETGLKPERLEIEITETALMRDRATTLSTLRQLKAMGVRLVMDDFGTGYSSLSNLQSFPFDKIKIDRSFISAIGNDESARAIVRAIVGLGRSLDLPVTAEGVETDAQYRMVVNEGCAQVQGFLFGRPGGAPDGQVLPLHQRGRRRLTVVQAPSIAEPGNLLPQPLNV
ncbi:MAG: bifunctional diguanylate cyclase/phosphodiesterase [Shinella sp.]|nr:MAG: bifunctional diguanylate cyclase/phosphodiesterase [Shinella sp.]